MGVQPRQEEDSRPYYIRMGYALQCSKTGCMFYGAHPNCVEKPIDRTGGDCFSPKEPPRGKLS